MSRLARIALAAWLSSFTAITAFAGTHAVDWSELRTPNRAEGTIELTGYLVPVDQDGDLVHEFMLVPWFGACSHSVPPPPDQIVRVTPERPYQLTDIREAVSISGTLRPGQEKTQVFIVDGVRVIVSGYSVGSAEVRKAERAPTGVAPRGASPRKFLR